jgi:hypothetical protein
MRWVLLQVDLLKRDDLKKLGSVSSFTLNREHVRKKQRVADHSWCSGNPDRSFLLEAICLASLPNDWAAQVLTTTIYSFIICTPVHLQLGIAWARTLQFSNINRVLATTALQLDNYNYCVQTTNRLFTGREKRRPIQIGDWPWGNTSLLNPES